MQGEGTGSSHMCSSPCSALNTKQLCSFITEFISIGLFTAAPKQRRDGRLLQLVMETAVGDSTEN